MTNPMVEENFFFRFFGLRMTQFEKKNDFFFLIFFENFEIFEILGPQGTLKTPWRDDEAIRTPWIGLKSEY